MITKIAVPTLEAVVHLDADEYFELHIYAGRALQVQKITFRNFFSNNAKRITYSGPRVLASGKLGQPIKETYLSERDALRAVPSVIFNLLEEQFLIYDKACARVAEALEV